MVALRALPTGTAAMGTLAVPIVGVVTSWIQLGEKPGAVEAAGMALIIAALALLAGYGVVAARHAPGLAGEEIAIPPVID